MKLKFEVFDCLCEMSVFEINDIDADKNDFGTQQDESRETAEQYGCGNMRFSRRPSTPEVLSKYGITENEYDEVCDKLEAGLSFGCCGWCV